MPPVLKHPGVYIQEIPSGVNTIAGVSTSVTAFVGAAKRGPVNRAVRILGFADFERRFGGLDRDSEMSYAVRQFFLNGGSEALVIRVAKNALAAERTLSDGTRDVLRLTARERGKSGNAIAVAIDYRTRNPNATFNLTLSFTSPDNPADAAAERFENLSMNSADERYVVEMLESSELVKAERIVGQAVLDGLTAGRSVSGPITLDVNTIVTGLGHQLRVSVNGLSPVTVELRAADLAGAADANARLDKLCSAIRDRVRAAAVNVGADLSSFQCARNDNTILMTSGQSGEKSSVVVLPGLRNDVTTGLKLGVAAGGTETPAAAAIRAVQKPDPGTLTSGVFGGTDLDARPDADHQNLQISLDGGAPDEVFVGSTAAAGADLAAKLKEVAARLEKSVRDKRPGKPAYENFTAIVEGGNRLKLASGTGGLGASVLVAEADAKGIAADLKLLAGSTAVSGTDYYLENGDEKPFTNADSYALFIPSRASREGLYALEEVDLFNILCLPGVTDPGILADAVAYCEERRAFLVVDPPPDKNKPDEMEKTVAGPVLPKSDHAAVYYPWLKVPDPLRNGKLRSVAPSGTVAGLFARIDSRRGVWKAPAGTEATMLGVQATDYPLTDPENGILNPRGVNCLRVFPTYGPVVWGARTLRGDDDLTSEYKYVPVRRLALYLEESLFRGLKWVVFEPNDEPLWAQIRLNVGAFLQTLFRQGAFQGKSPREAYFVKCDAETTTQTDRNLGRVNIVVGFAPLKPAEFVVISIQQMAGQIPA